MGMFRLFLFIFADGVGIKSFITMKKEKQVKSYTRKTKSGKVITVKSHTASYDAADKAMEISKKAGAGDELKKKKASLEAIPLGLSKEDFKEWYHWDEEGDPNNEGAKRAEKALKKMLGASGYKKYYNEQTDSYSARGHVKAHKALLEAHTAKDADSSSKKPSNLDVISYASYKGISPGEAVRQLSDPKVKKSFEKLKESARDTKSSKSKKEDAPKKTYTGKKPRATINSKSRSNKKVDIWTDDKKISHVKSLMEKLSAEDRKTLSPFVKKASTGQLPVDDLYRHYMKVRYKGVRSRASAQRPPWDSRNSYDLRYSE